MSFSVIKFGMQTLAKNDNDYFEPESYQTCIWKKNWSLYPTETGITYLAKLISDAHFLGN